MALFQSQEKRELRIFLHKMQQYFYIAQKEISVLVAGRGWGKSTEIGLMSQQRVKELPGSRGFFLGKTYTQILTKFLPPILEVWESLGIWEHTDERAGHFVIGRKPPSNWKKPNAGVKKFTNVISWINGTYIELLSMDLPNLNRGGSYDWGFVDEAQLVDGDKFYTEYYVSMRGNAYKYKSPLHQSLVLTGTMPWLASGQWLLDYKEKAKLNPDGILYMERPSHDNIDVLGERYFKKMRAELPALIYDVEILNKQIKAIPDGFYAEFSESKHVYHQHYNYNSIDINEFSPTATTSNDYDPNRPLLISFDFGAKVTCLLIAQEKEGELRFIDLLYDTAQAAQTASASDSMPKQLLPRVMTRFMRKYGAHNHIIEIYGDHTGHNRSDKSETSYEIVENYLSVAKKIYKNKVTKTTNPFHSKKYHMINDILKEGNKRTPKIKINAESCKGLIMSMQSSPVNDDYEKDKRSERDEKAHVFKQTHISDAFDYILVQKYKHLFNMGYSTVYSSM